MSATLKTWPLLAKIILVVGLFCGVVSAQLAFAQPRIDACALTGFSAAKASAAPLVSCPHCCAARPCCLTSKPASDAPSQPEPLSNERSHQLDHAPLAVTLELVSMFDCLAPPRETRIGTRQQNARPIHDRAPRGAVSCIWLI